MHAEVGDTIVVDPCCVGDELPRGVIIEISTHTSPEHYMVRWDDGRESIFYPSKWSHVVHPVCHGDRAGSS